LHTSNVYVMSSLVSHFTSKFQHTQKNKANRFLAYSVIKPQLKVISFFGTAIKGRIPLF